MKKVIGIAFTALFSVNVIIPVAKDAPDYIVAQGILVTVAGTAVVTLCYLVCRFMYKALKSLCVKLYYKMYQFFK